MEDDQRVVVASFGLVTALAAAKFGYLVPLAPYGAEVEDSHFAYAISNGLFSLSQERLMILCASSALHALFPSL